MVLLYQNTILVEFTMLAPVCSVAFITSNKKAQFKYMSPFSSLPLKHTHLLFYMNFSYIGGFGSQSSWGSHKYKLCGNGVLTYYTKCHANPLERAPGNTFLGNNTFFGEKLHDCLKKLSHVWRLQGVSPLDSLDFSKQ